MLKRHKDQVGHKNKSTKTGADVSQLRNTLHSYIQKSRADNHESEDESDERDHEMEETEEQDENEAVCGKCGEVDPADTEDDENIEWIQCETCRHWFHTLCLGIQDLPDYFLCDSCFTTK